MDVCKVDGCELAVRSTGYCNKHYARFWRTGSAEPPVYETRGLKRSHPLYITWFEKKSTDVLCDEWRDFWTFIDAIGERPSKKHILFRKDLDDKFSPTNFYWRENLIFRLPGESKKEHHARKWAHRMKANPGWDSERTMKRRYGIDNEKYREICDSQNNLCAICKKEETAVQGNTQVVRRLAIDHCHGSGKIRELLCWRCNGTLGKVEDSIELLQSMIEYLKKYK